jgi:hypothetical protein
MLDNGDSSLLKTDRGAPGGVQVEQIIIGKLLTLQNAPSKGSARLSIAEESCLLVRVFAVAQDLHRVEGQRFAAIPRQVGGNDRIVVSGQPEALDG